MVAMNGFIYVTMSKIQNELVIPKVVATCTYVGTSMLCAPNLTCSTQNRLLSRQFLHSSDPKKEVRSIVAIDLVMPRLLSAVSSLILLLLSIAAVPSSAFSATSNNMPSSPKAVETKDAPAPVGPYSQAVLTGNTLYVSGQVAIDPASGEMVGGGDVEAETRQVLKNMDAVLKEAGATSHNVVRTTVFLADLGDFAKVNALYADYFDGPVSPARACVQVAALPKAARVEIDCIAIL